jgi:16S rRNA (cytosine967-C5)-methyltransferase
LLPQENEDVAQAFSAANPDFEPMDVANILTGLKVLEAASLCTGGPDGSQYLRLWPQRHATDGFFAAVWQKK